MDKNTFDKIIENRLKKLAESKKSAERKKLEAYMAISSKHSEIIKNEEDLKTINQINNEKAKNKYKDNPESAPYYKHFQKKQEYKSRCAEIEPIINNLYNELYEEICSEYNKNIANKPSQEQKELIASLIKKLSTKMQNFEKLSSEFIENGHLCNYANVKHNSLSSYEKLFHNLTKTNPIFLTFAPESIFTHDLGNYNLASNLSNKENTETRNELLRKFEKYNLFNSEKFLKYNLFYFPKYISRISMISKDIQLSVINSCVKIEPSSFVNIPSFIDLDSHPYKTLKTIFNFAPSILEYLSVEQQRNIAINYSSSFMYKLAQDPSLLDYVNPDIFDENTTKIFCTTSIPKLNEIFKGRLDRFPIVQLYINTHQFSKPKYAFDEILNANI